MPFNPGQSREAHTQMGGKLGHAAASQSHRRQFAPGAARAAPSQHSVRDADAGQQFPPIRSLRLVYSRPAPAPVDIIELFRINTAPPSTFEKIMAALRGGESFGRAAGVAFFLALLLGLAILA